jgi:hypothetical protein
MSFLGVIPSLIRRYPIIKRRRGENAGDSETGLQRLTRVYNIDLQTRNPEALLV